MPLLLVRHARAGSRRHWDGPDEERPLSGRGRKQAEALVEPLASFEPKRVLSSPYVRCVETVEALAARLGLAVERCDSLAEGAPTNDVVMLARELIGSTTVLCSHGDVIPALLEALAHDDGLPLPTDYACAKGSTWVVRERKGRYADARYVPPKD